MTEAVKVEALSTEDEIDARSADGSEGTAFVKTFRVLQDNARVSKVDHQRNTDAVLREALNRGLHPKGEVEHVSTEEFGTERRGRHTYDITYKVEVVPSHDDTDAPHTVVPANNPEKPTPDEAKAGEVTKNPDKSAPALPSSTTVAAPAAPTE